MKSFKSRIDHRSVGPAATLLRYAPAALLAETHSILYKIFFTERLPREKTRGAWKGFWKRMTIAQIRVGMLHCEEGSGTYHEPDGGSSVAVNHTTTTVVRSFFQRPPRWCCAHYWRKRNVSNDGRKSNGKHCENWYGADDTRGPAPLNPRFGNFLTVRHLVIAWFLSKLLCV